MAVTYSRMISEVGARVRALQSNTAAQASTAYLNRTWKSAIIPEEMVIDGLLASVAHYAQIIAETGNHPWRLYFVGQTDPIADKGDIPTTLHIGIQELPIIGIYDGVYDSPDNQGDFGATDNLTKASVTEIQRCRRLNLDVFYFNIDGNVLRHTRKHAFIVGCAYDAQTEREKTTANPMGAMILPDPLESAVVAYALSQLVIKEEFAMQAAHYGQLAKLVEEEIRTGLTSVSSLLAPAPTAVPVPR